MSITHKYNIQEAKIGLIALTWYMLKHPRYSRYQKHSFYFFKQVA